MSANPSANPLDVEAQPRRHEAIVKIASGGMASVYLGALRGPLGFRQLVAIKKPHQHLLDDPDFKRTLVAEAQLAARIHHANVVDVRDVETVGDSIHLVMDYVEGASLGDLVAAWVKGRVKGGARLPPAVAVRILLDACAGLHAAHELHDDAGAALDLVHRDVSPQNILVGIDGVARVTDFGIAKCMRTDDAPTTQGALKGKVGYMAPEYVRGVAIDRRVDVFALGVVLWEALVGRRLFRGDNDLETLDRVQRAEVPLPSAESPELGAALDACVTRALARDRDARYATADAMRIALEDAAQRVGLVATHAQVGDHVRAAFGEELETRRRVVHERASAVPAASETQSAAPAPLAMPPAVVAADAASEAATAPDVARPSEERTGRIAPRVGMGVLAIIAIAALGGLAFASIEPPLLRATPSLAALGEIATATPSPIATPTSSTTTPTIATSATSDATTAIATSAPSNATSARAPTKNAPRRATPPPHMPPPNPYPR